MEAAADTKPFETRIEFPIFSRMDGIEVAIIPAATFKALVDEVPATLGDMVAQRARSAAFNSRVLAALDNLRLIGGRSTGIEHDRDVALFLAQQIGVSTLANARVNCRERYGPDRTPSPSALGRFWSRLREVDAHLGRRKPDRQK